MRLFIFCVILFFSQFSFSEGVPEGVLSPDGKIIAFIKATKNIIPNNCQTFSSSDTNPAIDPVTGLAIDSDQDKSADYAQQIWIYDVKSKKEHVLVHANFSCNDPEKQMLDPQKLKFCGSSICFS